MLKEAVLSSQARRFLDKASPDLRRRLHAVIDELPADPVPHNAVRVVGAPGLVFRARVGDYRILYRIEYALHEVTITTIDKRPRSYQ